jgi:hypothetical protein
MVMGMGGSEVAWWEDSISIRVWEVVWNMEGSIRIWRFCTSKVSYFKSTSSLPKYFQSTSEILKYL